MSRPQSGADRSLYNIIWQRGPELIISLTFKSIVPDTFLMFCLVQVSLRDMTYFLLSLSRVKCRVRCLKDMRQPIRSRSSHVNVQVSSLHLILFFGWVGGKGKGLACFIRFRLSQARNYGERLFRFPFFPRHVRLGQMILLLSFKKSQPRKANV
jgi:hypothetical protein